MKRSIRRPLLGIALALHPFLAAQQGWQPAGHQPASGSGIVYDTVRRVSVLYDGLHGTTHEWNGTKWTLVGVGGPVTNPEATGLAFDRARGRAVLWLQDSGQTWEFVGGQWLRITTNTPSQRSLAQFAFDETTRLVMAHGGLASSETWLYDGSTWTLASSAGPMQARGALAFDSSRNRMLLVGGIEFVSGVGWPYTSAMWEWDGTTWTRLTAVAPVAAGCQAVLDATRRRYVLIAALSGQLPQTFEWDGTSWSPPLSTAFSGALAFDAVRNVVVGFGGMGTTLVTAEWNGASWVTLDRAPTASTDYRSMVTDTRRSVLVMLAGRAETWEWDGTWRVASAVSPLGQRPSLAFDAGRGRTVLYTGIVSAAPGETWEWDGLAWTLATPAVSPPPRDLPGLVADDARQRVVLFGGFNGLLLADTWTWDGSNWTQHTTAPTPPARQDPGMAYDTQRQRVVMFGGIGGQETWEWNGTAWRLAATNGPSARLNPAMAYDPRRGRVVLHGGRLASTSRPGFDTWEWDGAEWTQTPVALGGLQEHSIAFDPRSGRMVAFGTDPVSRRDRWLELVHDDVGVPCHPLANGGATFTLDDAAPRLGHAFAATVTAPATSALAILLLGTQVPAPAFDLASIGLPGCRLHVGFVGFDQLLVLVVANGRATWSGLVPNSPSFTGMRFALQALVHSPQLGGLAATATNASVLVVRP